MRTKEKLPEIVLLRVFSMFMIVACHIVKYYTFIPGSTFLGQIFNVGVQIFLLISGYLYGTKRVIFDRKWIKGRLKRVYIPVIIVVVFDLILLCWLHDMIFNKITVVAYLLNLQGILFIQWQWFGKWITEIENLGPLWFTTIIMLCYSLIPLFQRLNDRIKMSSNVKRTYMIVLIVGYGISFAIQTAVGFTLYYFVTFFNGYVLAESNYNLQQTVNKKKMLAWGGAAVLSQVMRLILRYFIDGTTYYSTYVSFDHVILALFFVVLFLGIGKMIPEKVLCVAELPTIKKLDSLSFYIYLVHGLFCFGVWNVYAMQMNMAVQSVLFFAFTICAAVFLQLITDWVNRKLIK